MLWQPALPERYQSMSDEALAEAIAARRQALGDDLLILGHHYQQDDVIQHADLTGDSLKLSQMAAEEAAKRGTRFIIFCGVHFMAETADILTDDSVQVILPDLSAGCSMADMAEHDDVLDAWDEMHEALGPDWPGRVIPITYINSSAAVKAFVGEHDGACCTSTNAAEVFRWAIEGGVEPAGAETPIKLLFLPDQHLGRNVAARYGLRTEVDETAGAGPAQTAVWHPKLPCGGLSAPQVRDAQVLLWAGHCSVHKLFRPEHVEQARQRFADHGGVNVIVHPECCQEVVQKADLCGSTEFIIRTVRAAEDHTNWVVGTEVHLVNRLAREVEDRGTSVGMLSGCQCLCTTMYRIDPQHLLWALDSLVEGQVVNRVHVDGRTAELAQRALDRMLSLVGQGAATPAGAV